MTVTQDAPAPSAPSEPVTEQSLKPYESKRFVFVVRDEKDGKTTEMKGLLVGATPDFAVFQVPRAGAQIVKYENLVSFEAPEEKAKPPKVKTLRIVGTDDVKDHLLERHGSTYEELEGVAPAELLKFHDELHSRGTLVHKHGEPSRNRSRAEDAVAEVEQSEGSESTDSAEVQDQPAF